MHDTKAIFENLETGNCLVVTQVKEGWERDLLVCDKGKLEEVGEPYQIVPMEAIFGIYDLLSGSFVALVVESEPYVSIPGIDIRKVKKILVVPLFRHGRLLSDRKQKDEDRYLQLLHLAFLEHDFYFSMSNDITLTQQRLAIKSPKHSNEPVWVKADPRFFWNREVVVDLIACNAIEWIVPFMSAYIEIQHGCEIDEEKFTLLFISRRSRYRQGCRFTKRGIDPSGRVANFVETEQILLHSDGQISSYVQIRGSIPIVWSSPVHLKYDPVVYIDQDRSNSIDHCERHITEMLSTYADPHNKSSLCIINLIDNKKDQGKLGVAFQEVVNAVVEKSRDSPIKFVWFDFHHECKQKGKWNNLLKLLRQVEDMFKLQSYFCKASNGVVKSWQIGCMRTNCMDNLDRTNVVQSLLARRSLLQQLNKLAYVDTNASIDSPWKKFEKVFKSVWANNANAIAKLYAGTGALKVDFTRTGKRTLRGMFNDGVNAVMRYYINNFTDGYKQDAIDILLGNFRPDYSAPSPFQPRPGQETLSATVNKSFVLLLLIFSSLLLAYPYFSGEGSDYLLRSLIVSIVVTFLVVLYTAYVVMKKGSKIGERLAVHPALSLDTYYR